jgi:hypothetical protein
VSFFVRKTTAKLERVILTTLYFASVETSIVGVPRRGFVSCFLSGRSDGLLTKMLLHCQPRQSNQC